MHLRDQDSTVVSSNFGLRTFPLNAIVTAYSRAQRQFLSARLTQVYGRVRRGTIYGEFIGMHDMKLTL